MLHRSACIFLKTLFLEVGHAFLLRLVVETARKGDFSGIGIYAAYYS